MMRLTGIPPRNLFICDGFGFDAENENAHTVERDADELPVAWRLFAAGTTRLCKNGVPGELVLSAEDLRDIVEHHRRKGEMVPIDSNHYLFELASRRNLDEAEMLKLNPSGVAAMGFGHLELRSEDRELWIARVVWNPTARKLLAEKIFRYFSPAIRGLVTPPLRVTSVALENQPCIDHLDSLAASAEGFPQPQTKGFHMNPELAGALAELLGGDALALAAEAEGANLPEAIRAKAELFAHLRKLLGCEDAVADQDFADALARVVARAELADALKRELDQLKLAAEDEKHRKLIASGLACGKLANSQLQWADSLDAAALSAYLENAPARIPVGESKLRTGKFREGDAECALSSEDEKTIERFGLDRQAYLNEKKGLRK